FSFPSVHLPPLPSFPTRRSSDLTPWFLMGAILFGTMASKSGLARRLAYLVTLKIGTTYSRLLLALIVSDFLLTFLVPSGMARVTDRKSTRLNSSHVSISYAVFCL